MRVVVAALLTVAPVVTACSSGPTTGTLTGHFSEIGGLNSRTSRATAGTIWIWSGVVTRAQAKQMSPLHRVFADSQGQYSITLKPGTYSVWASPGRSQLIEAPQCVGPLRAVVTAGHQTRVNAVCMLV